MQDNRKRIGRNAPCWCRSGKKYKFCHWNRANQPRPRISDAIRKFKNVRERRTCLAQNITSTRCSGAIVQAHTVQRVFLQRIARSGQVYGFPKDLGAIVASSGIPEPRLLGVSQASCFTGFCSLHDSELFRPIELNEPKPTEEHAGLLAFRAFCYEFFAKQGAVLLKSHWHTLDAGLPMELQYAMQREVNDAQLGFGTALKEMEETMKAFEQMLVNREFSLMEYFVVKFDRTPDVLCCGCTNPDWDFHARQLQDLSDLRRPLETLYVHLLPSDTGGFAFFCWLGTHASACRSLLRSLVRLGRAKVSNAVVRLLFGSFVNMYFRPDWWEHLSPELRSSLLDRFRVAIHPLVPIPSDYLTDDRVCAVEWRVSGYITNVPELQNA